MDPGRHHDFLGNSDDRSNRNIYYGREIPEITSHHYYGPATATSRTAAGSNSRKPCGCSITGNGTSISSITCNSCRMNPTDEVGWTHTMTSANQMEHHQRTAGAAGSSLAIAGDYHHRMVGETNVRSNVRQNTMYVPQLPHQQHTQHMQQQQQQQQQQTHGPSMVQTQHPPHVGTMAGNRTANYWPQSSTTSSSSSSSMPYGAGGVVGDELLSGLPTQMDSVARRSNPLPNDYALYKSTSMPTNVTYANQHSSNSSNNSSVSGYQLPSSSLNSSNSLHQRVSAIGGSITAAAGSAPTNVNVPPFINKERIYEQQKYSSSSAAATAKMSYNAATVSSIYESHHHHLSSQQIAKSLPVDHHVINPSNLPASKEQHPSPNYARKCPQMYAPEEQSTAHQHLYMSTPQFSSEKFTRASPQQSHAPPSSDYTKLCESPSGSSYLVAPHSSPLLHPSQLRESPQFPSHTTSSPRNQSLYYGASQTQNPSKIHPPEMSPIVMKQSHQTHHYQYSKSPLPPPLPPSHMQQQTIPPITTQMAAKSQTNMSVVVPPPVPSAHGTPQHSQRYLLDNVKREDLEIYDNPNQTSSRHSASGIYINPYNTPPPMGDNCKEVALSASSSPYTTGSATPNYRVESPQFYPTKYAKLAMNENLSSTKHSLINQNTPPPSRAPSQRGQHQTNYYYEGNSHSAPSPAAATAASPSPSALLTTTSQTPMHHTEYMSSTLQTGPAIGPPPAQLVGAANMPQSYANQPNLNAQSHHMPHHQHQHQPTATATAAASLRNNDVVITIQPTSTHPYERAIYQTNVPAVAAQPALTSQHLKMKHVTHASPTSSAVGPVSTLQMQQASPNPAKPTAKHHKPNYRELINQKLAMRNATSEEELNMQIIKKTLNVDTQNIRQTPATNINQLPLTGNNRGTAAMPTTQLQATERIPNAAVREPATNLKHPTALGPALVSHHSNAALTMPSKARMIDLPEAIPSRICIKQEDEKPSPSSSGSTSSSPLDLSMRTVKTKADSTDYKYQQRPRLPAAATSTTSSEGRYTLPRVDSTPIFSIHAFEPGAATLAAGSSSNRQPNARHTSLERRNYTPPTQQVSHSTSPLGGGGGVTSYPHSSTQHIPASSTHHHHQQYMGSVTSGPARRTDLPSQPANSTTYENSLVIKAAPKLNNRNTDLVIVPSTTVATPVTTQTNAQIQRPSVLETNPFATVIKTENKRLNETPPHSPHTTIAAVERLPPDTSIMALPSRNPYGVVRSAIQTNHNTNANISSSNATTPSKYTLACEKNPNFLGRKRHLQEYSNQMSLHETEAKHKRYQDATQTPAKPQIPMRPADISVIAVNDLVRESEEAKTRLEESVDSASVIATTAGKIPLNSAKVIVNNSKAAVSNCSPTSVVVVCKQEPLTPTQENPNLPGIKQNDMPTNSFSARIRTKAELKGFTFNPPLPPAQPTPPEHSNSSPSPAKLVTVKQEDEPVEEADLEELIPAEKIKEEAVTKIELHSIPGLDEGYEDKNLLDFGWSKACNNFVEQLMTRSISKKKANSNQILTVGSKPLSKDTEMMAISNEAVTSSTPTTKFPLENHNLSNMESADNTTRSSFNRLDAGVESSLTFNNLNQDSINSPSSAFVHKKLSKSEREKKRFQQEKRLAERLKAKESSSETEDELDKRKTERLKKPPMKTKHKLKSPKSGNNTNSNSNSNSSNALKDKSRFSDCGSDTSTTDIEKAKTLPTAAVIKSSIKLEISPAQAQAQQDDGDLNDRTQLKNKVNEKCDINERDTDKKTDDRTKKKPSNSNNNSNKKPKEEKSTIKKKLHKEREAKASQEANNSSSTSEVEDEQNPDKSNEDSTTPSKQTQKQQALNTMTRSKHKQELEQQLANSKVLRNDKIIRNFSNSSSTNKIKRKYTRKYNTVNSLLESGGLSRESGIMKSTRLRAKLEKNGGKLNLIKANKAKTPVGKKLEASGNSQEPKSGPENVHDRNVIDLYRFKRALKVPPSLINIKHPGAHKIAASLPDLERHAEALEAYAKKRAKKNLVQQKPKTPKTSNNSKVNKLEKTTNRKLATEQPKSIIDLLHSRVTNTSGGAHVRHKSIPTGAFKPIKSCCSITTNSAKPSSNTTSTNCGMFSETSQTTESSELQMLPELKKDSDIEDDNEDNESTSGKKRHFSIFDTKVLPAKTRTESKLQQKKENIREIFVGDDRPASAPPEMTQILDSNEKMTYEQKYEQFLQQMNIVVSEDILGRLGRSSQAKKQPHTNTNGNPDIKHEEVDTESTSVIDADDLKEEDHKILPNHFRKRRGKYLRRKGSSGFDYIRKKKKPSSATASAQHNSHHHHNHFNSGPFARNELYDIDEYEHKIKTEDDVSREIQKWVLNKGVGQSAMHKAARQGYIDVIVYCLDRMGMNPDQKDNAGYTPLHEACTNGWLNIARVLLQYGANHSEAAHSGIRPLHEASENDHEEIVRLLLSYGADPLLATYSGQTPLMLASSKTMRDILSNHLVDVQSMGPDRKPWRFNGPWEIYDSSECGYNVFEGAPNSVCDMSRALLRRSSLNNNQIYQNNKKLLNVLNNTTSNINATTTGLAAPATATTSTTQTSIHNFSPTSNSCQSANNNNTNNNNNNNNNTAISTSRPNLNSSSNSISGTIQSSSEAQHQHQQQQQQLNKLKGETNANTVMEKCAVVLDNIDRFNSVRLYNDNKPEILVENSDSDGEMFEFEEADVLLPPLYLLKDEGTQDKWVLLNDLCNLLKVKSKDTLLNKIYPSTTSSSSASAASAHKSHMRELKMSDFLEKATCLQLLCAGEKLNICASKVVLIKYNENVRNLLGVKTILMKF